MGALRHVAVAHHATLDALAQADRLARQLRTLPPDVDVVAYCRGPCCVFADEAVRLLRRRGRQSRRFQDGFPEWQSAGLPVAADEPRA